MSIHCIYPNDPRVVVFDLEYLVVDPDLRRAHIYDIAAVHRLSGETFQIYIDPCLPDKTLRALQTPKGCRHVTKSWIQSKRPVSAREAIAKFGAFINRVTNSGSPLLVSHGCFRGDKIVLEGVLNRIRAPKPNWFFFDTLMWTRKRYPGLEAYSLNFLCQTFHIDNSNHHDALPDAKALCNLLGSEPLFGAVYQLYNTPLTVVPGIGCWTEQNLLYRNITCVEDLLQFALSFTGSPTERDVSLKTSLKQVAKDTSIGKISDFIKNNT